MTKRKRSKNSKLIFLVIITVFLLLVFFAAKNIWSNSSKILQTTPIQTSNLYHSPSQKFSVNIPSEFTIEDKFSLMILRNTVGTITISSVGTNYETIDEYVNDLSVKNHFSLTNRENLQINSLPAIKLRTGNRVDYFIYGTEWTVYTLSTDSEELYDDLDQIARSFRYIP